jgi:pteridine reductase
MLAQPPSGGIKGKIVLIGDWATERPYKDYLPYLVAKGALTTLTLAMARELAPHVPVALIQPAMIDPPADFTEQDKAAVLALTPLRRFGSPADVNRLILYLLEGTNFVTGACFRVDGGRFLGEPE